MVNSNAVILLSGGLDSATTLAIALERGFVMHALSFRYGQRHEIEARAAERIAKANRIQRHVFQTIDLRVFGGSALTADIEVPKDETAAEPGIPVTYVPARTPHLLAFALAHPRPVRAPDVFYRAPPI